MCTHQQGPFTLDEDQNHDQRHIVVTSKTVAQKKKKSYSAKAFSPISTCIRLICK